MKKSFNYKISEEQFQARLAADANRLSQQKYDVNRNLNPSTPAAPAVPGAPVAPGAPGAQSGTANKQKPGTQTTTNVTDIYKNSPELNSYKINFDKIKTSYDKIKELLASATKESGRVFEDVPTFDPENPCMAKNLITSTVSAKEVTDLFNKYTIQLNELRKVNEALLNALEDFYSKTMSAISASRDTIEIQSIEAEIAKYKSEKQVIDYETVIQQRKQYRLDVFGKDQDALYRIMSSICTLTTKYNYEKKLTGIGSNLVWRRLIYQYQLAIKIVQNMEKKARMQFKNMPAEQNELIAEQYAYYVNAFTAKINELAVEPAMAAFGK
jgi:hypothetical protein